MKLCQPHYIVQSTETGEFLIPHEGDLSMTKMFNEAVQTGLFEDIEEAYDAADGYLDSYSIATVYVPKEDI